MIPRLRTVALLMLLAGLALGLFASRALEATNTGWRATPSPAQPRIEYLVGLYEREYDLSPAQAERIRQELVRFDQEVRSLLYRLRQQHASDFEEISQRTNERVERILAEAAGR